MVYPFDFETKLGFDQIRQRLNGYCISTLGRNEVEKIRFRTEYDKVKELLDQGSEFKSIKERGIPFPLSQYYDPSELYPVVAIEDSFIEAESLREIALSIQVIEDCVGFLKKEQGNYPNLFQLSLSVALDGVIKEKINATIDDMGKLKDNASPDLNRIRKKLRDEAGKARRLVDQMFREAVGNGMVPEGSSPVIRDGRVVIPVLSEFKRKVKGVIMDESATGQTVYMEPTEVIEANNEIRNLELEERREAIKILRRLTTLLRDHLPDIKLGFVFLGQLDFIQAKTRFSFDIEANTPQLVAKPKLAWVNARHPLLFLSHKGKSPVVPLNIDLKEDERFLLVSGPNAGGKSVCLKTVGLLQYMVQCGLLIPLDEKSEVGIFHHIFLDIGDQQSIENDLSTYSSHLRNMRHFVDRANEDTLVLMDELGAGTDPNFGGGIAEAILKTLVEKGVWGVATTHYYNLKLYADHNMGIRNAAMQFDSKNLEPRFILDIGKPGSSFALEIARKTGLGRIIKEAENIIGKDLTGLETLIKKVSDEKQELIKREREVRDKEIKYNELLNKYDQLNQELESKKKEIINKAKEEAAGLIQQTNREIEKTIRHIKENRAEKKETRRVRQSLEGLKENVRPSIDRSVAPVDEKIEEGDYVRMVGQDVTGRVVSLKGKSAVVEFGDMRSSIKVEKLVKSSAREDKAVKSRRSFGVDLLAKQTGFNTTLDVRGMRVEEIIPVLDQFLDDAVLLGHGGLRILHGKGEGVLRGVVRDRLKLNKSVVSFGHEHIERGGDGITTVVLK
ncbi:MAG: Smr/MutS family protein [Cyclobacteriaceae bacterium]